MDADVDDVRWSDVTDVVIEEIHIYDDQTGEAIAGPDGDGEEVEITINPDGTFSL